ncbi:MAG: alkaline phosphatase D family protein [Anaerolineae bacterium]|nr:alkaline phosphatase D family protein [Anaerolineae bacterium]
MVALLRPSRAALARILVLMLGALLADCRPVPPVPPSLPAEEASRLPVAVPASRAPYQGEMAGEVTQDSVVLQARLSEPRWLPWGDVRGRPGVAAFALSTTPDFRQAFRTRWMVATPEHDYIVKTRVTGLEPGTRYYYRLLSGPSVEQVEAGPTGTFRTLDAPGTSREVKLAIVTGMNRFAFWATVLRDGALRQRFLGFPALETIVAHGVDFFLATGDSVYYDSPAFNRAKTREAMRAKWHAQFATPRFQALFLRVPTYWQKDDHDYRYDDADPHGPYEPSAALGAEVFLEQVPLADPRDPAPRTYRTYRINDLLQIWLMEGRDFRDPNTKPPGPDKSLWGAEQKAWLERTLLESDAVFKVLISPTPMVGVDDLYKGVQGGVLAPFFGGKPLGQGDDPHRRDSHTTPYGFRDEAEAFFAWLVTNGFLEKNFYIVCGDRHWQYHAVHPTGVEEFSVGALVDGNARRGRRAGDPESTDPEGRVRQPYLQEEPSGGFLELTVRPPEADRPAVAEFAFYDEHGTLLYRVEKVAHP